MECGWCQNIVCYDRFAAGRNPSFNLVLCGVVAGDFLEDHLYGHPLAKKLNSELQMCRSDPNYCDDNHYNLTALSAKVANDYAFLLLHDVIQSILIESFFTVSPTSRLGQKISHIRASLAYSIGDFIEAKQQWKYMNDSDLVALRSWAAQEIVSGNETNGLKSMERYSELMTKRVENVVIHNLFDDSLFDDIVVLNPTANSAEQRSPKGVILDKESEEQLLAILLEESFGGIRVNPKLSDVNIPKSAFRPLEASLHFRLGVGLAKLGMFDLSLKHVSLSATPWEAPLYRLRSQLAFPPTHPSLRSLAQAVDLFESQCESILLFKSHKALLMSAVCNSLDDAALALQALPLLHLAGYSAPREGLSLGHSPVGLQRLLGEVYTAMCPISVIPPILPLALPRPLEEGKRMLSTLDPNNVNINSDGYIVDEKGDISKSIQITEDKKEKTWKNKDLTVISSAKPNKVRLGVVSGSFDGIAGRLIVGMFDELEKSVRNGFFLIAMCFPTPRDHITDRVNAVFDKHINLSPSNKSQAVERILLSRPDFILYSDAGLDSRVFALAHERLAPFQGALWGWGGSLGIPSIDYYITPEVLWLRSRCRLSDKNAEFSIPQELYSEQVVLLEGIPPLPGANGSMGPDKMSIASSSEPIQREPLIIEDGNILEMRYLLPSLNSTHLYLFSGSVRYLHPEFDSALGYILKTDPKAIVVVATPGVGRDKLPATHPASRYDLMHPTMPAAAVTKVKARMRLSLGLSAASRVRFMPPLDDRIYQALKSVAIAILDPFPVGMHIPILEAVAEGIPVVSAPALQECTNSHTFGIAHSFGVGPQSRSEWPESAEDYAVFAIRLQHESSLRNSFRPKASSALGLNERRNTFTKQLLRFLNQNKRVHDSSV